jgi:16S rRNA C967 or C1407 C5-methylase (RsmB/RsmF family)/NOL1/NOP2/fmu family ribosome biogenesis protein
MKAIEWPPKFESGMRSLLGSDFDAFRQSLSADPPTSIRINPGKGTRMRVSVPVPWSRYGSFLAQRPVFTLDPLFHAGAYYVQEASSMFLEQAFCQCIDLNKPLHVLDLCAAPGGKSTHVLSLISKESLLVANETIRSRIPIVTENLERWGHCNVVVSQNDPDDFSQLRGFFDVVVVDAPCSGEGLFRKDPSAMLRWTPENVGLCAARQKRILASVWPSLKEGGVLIYCTCTHNQTENEENLQWLRNNHAIEFLPIDIDPSWGITRTGDTGVEGYRFYPHRVKGEGFFMSVIRKSEPGISNRPGQPKSSFRIPPKEILEKLYPWIDQPEEKQFFVYGDQLHFIPAQLQHATSVAAQHLHLVSVGTAAAKNKQGKLIPAHPLALSLALNRNSVKEITVEETEALQYLRKDAIRSAANTSGFAVVTFNGATLGWVNALPDRLNNLYPSSRRIRMELPGQDLS